MPQIPAIPAIAKVIIDLPIREVDKIFDYSIPDQMKSEIDIGVVVVVPFGRTKKVGFVVDLTEVSKIERVLPIDTIVNDRPVFGQNMVSLCRWISEYYLSTYVEALKLAIPPGYTSKITKVIRIKETQGLSPATLASSKHLRNVYNHIKEIGGTVSLNSLKSVLPYGDLASLLKKLELAGFVESAYELEKSRVKELTANYAVLSSEIAVLDGFKKAMAQLKKAPKQKLIMEVLFNQGSCRVAKALSEATAPHSSLQALVERGFIRIEEKEVNRLPIDHFLQNDVDVRLTGEQENALSVIMAAAKQCSNDVFLLQGVTGSGKTEIYLRAIRHVIKMGKSAIVLVPEIALTAQAVARFKARFGESVAVLHSGLGAGERLDQWRGIREGRYKVVVGARSAVFAPVENAGIIIVDEEHESSYKQGRSPRYNAREVAIKRGELENACVVLGSATPSLETKWLSETGIYRPLYLRYRVQKRELPRIEIVDLREERHEADRIDSELHKDNSQTQRKRDRLHGRIRERTHISGLLKSRLTETLDSGKKAILFLNRRGFSNFIICEDCGFVPKCKNCAVSLTYHSVNKSLRCHHCNYAALAPEECPKCGGLNINFPGSGTQRVEIELHELYAGVPIIRMDADTTSRKGAHQKWLAKFQSEKSAILLGTQMIAKGLDFPEVTLVGVINADTSLHLPEFRAAERTFQLMMQVAGRAGRGEQPGRVVMQTYSPESDPLQSVLISDYDKFYKTEIEYRKELGYPPFSSIIRLVFSGKEPASVVNLAKRAGKIIESAGFLGTLMTGEIATMVGPSPAPLLKVKGEYRWHLLLKAHDALTTKNFLADNYRRLIPEKHRNVVSLIIDVDPVWVL